MIRRPWYGEWFDGFCHFNDFMVFVSLVACIESRDNHIETPELIVFLQYRSL